MTVDALVRGVVVGVDGSAAGLAAARWASAEAARRAVALRIIQVHQPMPAGVASAALSAVTAGELSRAAQSVHDAVRLVQADTPTLPVTGEVVFGNVITGLLAAGAESGLLVVGCHSILPRSLRRSWSYVAALTSRSPVPVTVVEPVVPGGTIDPAASGPVVVLTDTTGGLDRLAGYGCSQAQLRHTDVEIVWVPAGPGRRHGDRFADELELFDALVNCRKQWTSVNMTGLVASERHGTDVQSRLSRASLLVMDARRGRKLLRRSGLKGPLGIRTGPRALTVLPT